MRRPKPSARRAYWRLFLGGDLSRSGHGPTPRRRSLTKRSVVWATCCSGMGTTAVRHKTIPKRPAGSTASWWCSSTATTCCMADQERRSLTAELAKHGAVESVRCERARVRVRRRVARGGGGGGEGRAKRSSHRRAWRRDEGLHLLECEGVRRRGWTCCETSGVSGEAVAQAQYFEGLGAVIDRGCHQRSSRLTATRPRVADAGEARAATSRGAN